MSLTRLDKKVQVEEYYLDKEKLLAGNPLQELWIEYTDRSEKFCAGIWQSNIGKWTINYTEEEYCHILEGVSIITEANGTITEVTAGDRFVIPAGFQGTWEVLEPTRKHFVIYE